MTVTVEKIGKTEHPVVIHIATTAEQALPGERVSDLLSRPSQLFNCLPYCR